MNAAELAEELISARDEVVMVGAAEMSAAERRVPDGTVEGIMELLESILVAVETAEAEGEKLLCSCSSLGLCCS